MSVKYFTIEGKRYGWRNTIETHQGKRTVYQYRTQKTSILFFATLLFFYSSYLLYSYFHNILFACLMLLPGLYFLVCLVSEIYTDCTVTCMFCSTDQKEAEELVAKIRETHNLDKDSHEIIIEDGWYMVFRKDAKTR